MKHDLGQKNSYPGCCASPSPCGDEKIHYPSLYLSGDEKIDFPDEGTAVITFRKVDSGENVRDPDDPQYRCELEVRTIEVKDGAPKKDGDEGVGEAFKRAAKKKMAEKSEGGEDY